MLKVCCVPVSDMVYFTISDTGMDDVVVETLALQKEPLTAFHVRQLHALVLAKIDDENAGQYRRVPVRILGAAHEPAPMCFI